MTNSSNIKTLSVSCPTCQKEVLMTSEFPHRPFCSHRCQTIDFGGWAAEDYTIAGKSVFNSDPEEDLWSSDDAPNDS